MIRLILALFFLTTINGPARAGQTWFMLVPPSEPFESEKERAKKQKPLNLWDNVGAYETAGACEEDKKAKIRETSILMNALSDETNKAYTRKELDSLKLALCVSTDDKRLK